jgi:hypothetical protein
VPLAGKNKEKKIIYILSAIPGRASAKPCKQGSKQPVVQFTVLVIGRRQEDACKFNHRSNNCVLTMRYNLAPFSSYIQQQPF